MNENHPSQKATGWLVPLLFCAAIILLAAIIKFFLPEKADLPDIPQSLYELAKNRKIDLDNVDGKVWKDQIVNAASGFAPKESKDAKLVIIIEKALAQKRFDAALAAAVLIKGHDVKNAALTKIFELTSSSCENAPWAVFAIHGMGKEQEAAKLINQLEIKWQECK